MERQQIADEKPQTPPYVDYHAFTVFLNELKKGLPQRIDTKYLRQTKIAKSAYRTLLVTLRSLRLIDLEGKPTPRLHSILKEGDELTANLQELVRGTYGEKLLTKQEVTSPGAGIKDISPYFEETYGLSPSTASACASFFLRLARDAKLLRSKRKGKGGIAVQPKADLLSIKVEVLRKLPDFRNGWQPADIQVVLQQFEKLLSHLEG